MEKQICSECDYCIPMYDFSTETGGYICIAPKIFYSENICYVINDDCVCPHFKRNEKLEIN